MGETVSVIPLSQRLPWRPRVHSPSAVTSGRCVSSSEVKGDHCRRGQCRFGIGQLEWSVPLSVIRTKWRQRDSPEESGRYVRCVVGQRAWEAVSAYLIRSRPSGRKINSRARCYCTARGRAATRAQHNIYTAGPAHSHTDTLTFTSAYT